MKATNSEALIDSLTLDGYLYGVPFTTNTWYMFYDKRVFSEEDVKNLDTMLEKGVVSFPFTNSWYLPAFYFGNGCTLFGDGTQEELGADFGGENAVEVTEYLLDLVQNPNFRIDQDGSGIAGLRDGSISAMFSGSWDAAAPEGWQEDAAPPRQAEDVIYELHVREFSWAESGGFPASVRGTYAAFCCDNTSLPGHPEQSTGLAYLRELGVTHVQLMPVYDFGSVDESDPDGSFNWGYDPVNYNVPEGSYSSDPTRGEVRVRELRELVQSLHRQGFRVVMDVVYNHTYSRDSWLERTVPGYYYRTRRDGSDSNGSGCGNDIASERSMCAQYILDSVLFWAEEYHMDGFRFDLMGLLDAELMQRIRAALDERFGRGEKLVYGEPWAASSTVCRRGTRLADKAALSSLDPEIGAFCDAVRDAVKGSVSKRQSPGFVNGGRNFEERILQSVTAWCGGEGAFHAAAPSQVITYLSCHDDMTLWDKLVATLDPNLDWDRGTEKVLWANRLAAAICMTCQGRLFLLSGEEFGRTKQGEDNTFRSPIELNRLDWQRAWDNRELTAYYRGLIALRKQIPALCDKSVRARERVLHASVPAPRCVTVELDNPEGPWKRILLIYNASSRAVSVPLPDGRWNLLADGEQSFWWRAPHPVKEAKAAPGTALILGLA